MTMANGTEISPPQSPPSPKNSKRKWITFVAILVFIIVIVKIAPGIRAIYILYRHGILTDNYSLKKYEGDRETRLKELYAALKTYQQSNGQFPEASGWMDAIKPFIRVHNMTQKQSDQKLHDPTVNARNGYGFAFNKKLSNKYIGDIKNQKSTVLIYTSQNITKNASGNPKTDIAKPPRGGENIGITVNGTIVKLP